jgi:hypothetical protein
MAETQYFSAPGAIHTVTGAPSAGTDEVQSIVGNSTVTAGTFRLSFQGFVTAPISWTADTAILETALNNLPSLANGGTGLVGVVVTGGALPGTALVVTFSGRNVAKKAQPLLVLHRNSLTGGGSMTIAEDTPGVDASHRQAARGAILIRLDAGTMFLNTSATPGLPTWAAQA